MRRQMLVVALVGTLALVGCSSAPQAQDAVADNNQQEKTSNEYQPDIDDVTPVSLAWMDFDVPSSWDMERDGSTIQLVPSVGGLVQVSNSAGINFVGDGSEEVDVLLDSLNGDVTQVVSDKREGTCGNAKTYTVDIERSDASELHKGYAEFIISGHAMYMFIMVVPESAYDHGYDEVLRSVLDSVTIEGSVAPLGSDDLSQPQEESNSPDPDDSGSSTTSTVGEGTYRVGTDIEAGEYKLTTTSSTPGYWEVTNSSAPDADIVGNDNFEGTAYVTVADGQYLKLNRCTGEKI